MAKIKLSELSPAGSELLQDSESFLNELKDYELENVIGSGESAYTASNKTEVSSYNYDRVLIQLEPRVRIL